MGLPTKLFIPGPVEVSESTLNAFRKPMIGHRSHDFKALYASLQVGLQQLFYTQSPVFLSTSSAWGIMEGALRNLVKGKVLNCMNGAFSDKWHDVTKRCGYEAEALKVEWGEPILPEQLKSRLQKGDIDIVTLIHNETSTGCMNPLADLMSVIREFSEILVIVDTVSSFSISPILMDELGIDVMLTGVQKALALPPGLSLFSVSKRAMKRAETITERGYYFDFLEFQKNHESYMTPSTPSISHIYALEEKIQEIATEGLQNRYERHRKTNQLIAEWVIKNRWEFFAPEGYRSLGLTCIKNNKQTDIALWLQRLRKKYSCIIDGGYGKIKGKTFRISNMGNETEETISLLISWLNETYE